MDRDYDAPHDEELVQLNSSTANVVVVDNVPKTEMKRYEKLYAVIRKIFTGFGNIIDDGLYIPVEGDPQMTSGYAFIEVSHTPAASRSGGVARARRQPRRNRVPQLQDHVVDVRGRRQSIVECQSLLRWHARCMQL
jgi:hypothetical protein